MRIYTKTGDGGETGLFGGRRVSKADLRVAAYGDVDELNAGLGQAETLVPDGALTAEIRDIQADLFALGSDLATPPDAGEKTARATVRLDAGRSAALEALIDRLDAEAAPLANFILPGGHPAAAALQVCRTVCRRAERTAVALAATEDVPPAALVYLNRLSDLLFVMARWVNAKAGVDEPIWSGRPDGPPVEETGNSP